MRDDMTQPNRGTGKYREINKKVIWDSRAHGGWLQCQGCGTTKIRHKGGGLCLHCYDKHRAKYKAKRREILKKNHDRWYAKVKGTEKYIKYTNERALHWRKTSTAYRAYLYSRMQTARLKRFLEDGRIKKSYVTYLCSCCEKKIIAPFTPQDLEEKQKYFAMFKRMVIERHKVATGYPQDMHLGN